MVIYYMRIPTIVGD